MSTTYSVNAARSGFPKLIARVEQGEEIVITRDNTPVARLVPIAAARRGAEDKLSLAGLGGARLGLTGLPGRLWSLRATVMTAALAVAAGTVILAALAFEHIGGYAPCPLCLQQRYAYYLGIPAAVAALVLLRYARPRPAAALLAAIALAFITNAGIGVYQAGAEWRFWDPPSTCSAPGAAPSFDIDSMDLDKVPAICGVASWRFLGLSFAGWNAVTSALLAVAALAAALKALPTSDWPRQRRPG